MKKSNHKIAVITHPLQYNYGGVLQAYALNCILSQYVESVCFLRNFDSPVKDSLKYIIEQFVPFYNFKRKYLNERLVSLGKLERWLTKSNVDIVVIGSDQVWRPSFAFKNFTFGQFASSKNKFNIFAYAASFGTEEWEYTDEQEIFLRKEIKKFLNVSVREKSGVDLCKQHLDVKAQHVLDPTLLLNASDYLALCKSKKHHGGGVFCYLLDYENLFNKRFLRHVLKIYGGRLNETHLVRNKILKRLLPTLSIPGWLECIYNADVVVTDSFHGCIFSILFEKDFFVLENQRGGNARIESLLKLFHLENRFIKSNERISVESMPGIDWHEVHGILQEQRKVSMDFIVKSINGIKIHG